MIKELIYPDVKNIYLITSNGKVLNKNTLKTITPYTDKNTGYCCIKLVRYNNTAPLLLHRLVAHNFVGSVLGMQVNHEDGNKQNNDYRNLSIVTAKENTLHAYRNNLCKILEDRYNASLKNKEIHKICEYLEQGKSYEFIMQRINVSKDVLKKINNGENYKEISKLYNIKKINRRLRTNNEEIVQKITELIELGITNQRKIIKSLNLEYNNQHINLIKYIKKKIKKERSTTIESDYYIINIM